MTAVLVTGATTPLGRAFVEALADDARVREVVAVGVETGPAVFGARAGRVRYVQADLTRPRQMRRMLFGPAKDVHVDVLVHMAFHRATDTGARVHAQNVEATRNLLLLCEEHPTVRRFVLRSHSEVYALRPRQPTIVGENHPLELDRQAPQWVLDRVEADMTVGMRMGMSGLGIAVLRIAECLEPASGSQLLDYLQSRVCLRPLGYDPVLNLISKPDFVRALSAAVFSDAWGVFNIPGKDTLPLSDVIRKWRRIGIPLPSPLLHPLYQLRRAATALDFRYDLNNRRFHFGGVLDGRRARDVLGYTPKCPIPWPH